ncbi:MAG: carboxypeptidase regulatory-like domain-containing protein [Candidatus Hydrogenedentes bacterium]|nr:carboxypeptidase regulatory-like domain-containing protein [Candidatus Hydrogenedentota bacterium]
MIDLASLWSPTLWAQLPMALLHTIWEGTLISVLLWAVLRRLPAKHADLRYGASVAAMAIVVATWWTTWALLGFEASNSEVMNDATNVAATAPSASSMTRAETPAPTSKPTHSSIPWQQWTTYAWLAGVAAMTIRTAALLTGAGQLRRESVPCTNEAVLAFAEDIREAIGVGRRVALRVSQTATSPFAMGILWPVVVLPAHIATGMPPEYLRAVLAHEFAHIRRWDYLVNLMQLLVESLLFFNPAVWWISRQIRIEREACCDAMAIRHCGNAVEYARVLADAAERTNASLAAVMAMGGPLPEQSLLERVRRLLAPNHRPILCLPWYTFSIFLLVSTILLASLGGTTFFAVTFIAQAMKPEERIAKMAEVQQKTRELHFDDSARVVVTGTVQTEDGTPLPKPLNISFESITDCSSCYDSAPIHDGHYEKEILPGFVLAFCRVDGYALSFAEPTLVTPEQSPREINVVLRRGRTAQIHCMDNNGTSVANARVVWNLPLVIPTRQKNALWFPGGEAVSDAEGMIQVEHCWDRPLKLEVIAPGYQMRRIPEAAIPTNEAFTCMLEKARPARIIVKDRVTGAPIEGAELLLLVSEGLYFYQCDLQNGLNPARDAMRLGVSDPSGQILFDTASEGTRYWCGIAAPNGRKIILDRPIVAGQETIDVEVGPPLSVRGTIFAPPDTSDVWNGPHEVGYEFILRIAHQSHGLMGNFDAVFKDGVAEFFYSNLWPCGIVLYGGEDRNVIDLREPVDNVELRLAPKVLKTEQAKRKVVVHFVVPEGNPAPQGTFRLDHIARPGDTHYTIRTFPILFGEVHTEVPVPTKLAYHMDRTAGYWIKQASEIVVDAGDEPFRLNVPTLPAGAIHGKISGSHSRGLNLTLKELEQAPSVDTQSLDVQPEYNADGEYSISPLPIGGVYCVMACADATTVISDSIALTEAEPIHEVNLTLPEGKTISGQVTLPDGTPLAGCTVMLKLAHPKMSSSNSTLTDGQGKFRFEHVNPEWGMSYSLEIRSRADFQPLYRKVKPGAIVDLRLEHGKVLEGTLIEDASGLPIPGAQVCAISLKQHGLVEAEVKTDKHGKFRFSTLSDGEYRLSARDAREIKEMLVTPDTGKPVELRVTLADWSTLKPAKKSQ